MVCIRPFQRVGFVFFLFVWVSACTHTRLERYRSVLEPRVGQSNKAELDRLFGTPTECVAESKYKKCEYRTARERNDEVPAVFKRQPAMGPDLSPYSVFDVLYFYYDKEGVLRHWEPVVIP